MDVPCTAKTTEDRETSRPARGPSSLRRPQGGPPQRVAVCFLVCAPVELEPEAKDLVGELEQKVLKKAVGVVLFFGCWE